MKRILQEPLVHFLLLGGLIFVLYGFLNRNNENPESNTIIIQDSDVVRLTKAYQQSWNKTPDAATLKDLIENEVESEMLYREALRLNLDHNDEIIRRRLKQKYEFLVKDLAVSSTPTEEELRQFYKENPANYQSSVRLSFHQIYFSPDLRSNPLKDANAFYEQVKSKAIEDIEVSKEGDAFHLQSYYANRDFASVRQVFGKDFANTIFEKPQSAWLTPVSSGYGVHIVYVSDISDGAVIDFENVKEQVLQDWQQEKLAVYNKNLLDNLTKQYEIVYDLNEYEELVD